MYYEGSVLGSPSALIGSNPIGFVCYVIASLIILSIVKYGLDSITLHKASVIEEGMPMINKKISKERVKRSLKAVGEIGLAVATNFVASGATLTQVQNHATSPQDERAPFF